MACFKIVAVLKGITERTVLSSVSFIIVMFSVVGNTLVIYVIWRNKNLHQPTPLLISALASCDALIAMAGQLPYTILAAMSDNYIDNCTTGKYIGFIHILSCGSSLLLLSLITRDRYLHVSKGLQYSLFTNVKQTLIGVALCLFAAFVMAGVFLIDQRFVKMLATLSFSITASSCFTYICIKSKKIASIVHLRCEEIKKSWAQVEDDEIKIRDQNEMDVERSVNRSIFAVIILYSICWIPVTFLMAIFTVKIVQETPADPSLYDALTWVSLVSYLNGAVNPFLYGYRCDAVGTEIKKVGTEIKNLIFFKKSAVHPMPSTATRESQLQETGQPKPILT